MLAMQNQSESAGSPAKLNPSRSAQNLTSNKLELPPKSKPDKQPQQPLTTPQKYYPGFSPPSSASNNNSSAAFRFGTPDTRASYSERRPAAVRPTAHNHPPAKTSSLRNADEKSMSVSLASLSRSNGSLSAEQDSAKTAKLSCPPASTPRNNAASATPSTSNKRREFGSHGSLDALTNGPERENFFALLRDLGAQSSSSNGSSTGSREASRCSPERDVDSKPVGCAPSRLAELLRPNFSRGTTLHVHSTSDTMSNTGSTGPVSLSLVQSVPNRSATLPPESCSPKPRSKFQRFWEKEKPKEKSHPQTSESAAPNPTSRSASEPSIFKRLRAGSNQKATPVNGLAFSAASDCDNTVDRLGTDASDAEARLDDRLRRKAFIHYDCQSMSVNLGYAARLRGLLAQRRNTTTGASAASMAAAAAAGSSNKTKNFTPSSIKNAKQQLQQQNSAAPVLQQHAKTEADETDEGDSKTNELVLSCPYFRNELGGEPEWSLGLSRNSNSSENGWPQVLHKPSAAYGVAVLEFPVGQTHWKHGICPYQRQPSLLERGDQGAYYYGTHFYGQDHQNWFGLDENLGPVAISVRREKAVGDEDSQSDKDVYAYRLIIRSSELATCRGTVLEEAIPTLKPPGPKGLSMRDVLDMVAPEIQLSCLRLAIPGSTTEQQLLKLDQQGLSNHYKVGIMYCKAGQETEEEMYNNEEAGPAFEEFLSLIGQKVRLKNFDKYKAGLDNKMDSTGLYSVYAQHQGCEIMFHVSTLLPFTPNNRQQLLRKRHIGNDIVTIVFQEPGALPFTPKNIRSQFQHVFIIVRVVNPCSERTQYKVAVSRSKEVPVFGPPIPVGATFPKSKTFVDFLLAKVINAEHAAHRSEKFATMATRTRQEYLKDLATNYITSTTLDSNSKFPILTFTSRKKERLRPKFIPDAVQRGAICWQVLVDDVSSSGRVRQVECLLGISVDSAVLVEETSKECIWAVSSRSVLGWTSSTASLRIFYHQGECITVHGRDSEADEIPEMVTRLTAVTSGCGTRELSLRRNAVGQLGFHVQPDGLITEVEPHGPAWQAGLRQGSRLVEICKVAIATLSHEQMVDLLKTSSAVTVTVLPPLSQDVPRRGCTLQSCSYIVGAADGEYDNINNNNSEPENAGVSNAVQQQQASIHSRRLRYERSVSPPRSSNSSGYGTGSSSRSFSQGPVSIARFPSNPEGTLTSTSSGHSSDDPWYDVTVEPIIFDAQTSAKDAKSSTPPPPLPSRQGAAAEATHRIKRIATASSEAAENSASFGPLSIMEILRSNPNEETTAATSSVKATVSKYSTPPPPKPKPVLESPLLVSRASNYEDYKRLQAIINAEAAPQEPFKESSTNKTRPLNPPDYHHAIQSRLAALKSSGLPVDQIPRNSGPSPALTPRSEDELSASSVHSLSPRSGRKLTKSGSNAGTLTPSSCSSRNQSPRLLVEAKLKSASSASSSTGSKGSQRGSSNLQEELLRLITPDYESNGAGSEIDNSVIVTHARPAAVLPKAAAELNDLPDAEVMDWSSLVSAAARAIQGAASSMGSGQDAEETPVRDSDDSLTSWIEDVTEKLGLEAANLSLHEGKSGSEVSATTEFVERMRQLEHHVGSLENRLRSEEDRRQMLEAEIRRLRDDNMRLQGESQSAAQQLKRFTDWFFQTIERP